MGTTFLQIDELPEEVRAEIDAGAKAPYAIEHLDCMFMHSNFVATAYGFISVEGGWMRVNGKYREMDFRSAREYVTKAKEYGYLTAHEAAHKLRLIAQWERFPDVHDD